MMQQQPQQQSFMMSMMQNNNQMQMRPMMIMQKQRNGTKNQMYKAIKEGDLDKVRSLLKEFDMDPNEEISVNGFGWTALHYSCHFLQPRILELFVNVIYRKNMSLFTDVMNIKTKEGWTPLMLACIYKSIECIQILLMYGGIELLCRDYKGFTVLQLAENFQTTAIINIIKDAMKGYPNGVVPANITHLKAGENLLTGIFTLNSAGLQQQPKELDKETQIKYKKLLEEGYRLPCVICQVEQGYIKYTNCCGQPMHGHCQTEKITSCPVCRSSEYSLRTDVLFPERAFSLEKP